MRTLSFLFLLAILGILGCQSSKTSKKTTLKSSKASSNRNPFYKPFSEFKGDTLQYLTYNFVEHKAQYIGKPFSVLYHDLEIPVKSCLAGPDANNLLASSGIGLYFVDADTRSYHMHSDAGPLSIVNITWEEPVSTEALLKLYKASDSNWTPSFEAFVAGSIIRSVSVLKYVNRKTDEEE